MFKLVLCHRIKKGLSEASLHDHWRQARSALVLDLKPALQYGSYAQTHQSSRLDPVYLSLLFARSRLVTALLATKKLPQTPPAGSDESWDVTDEFEYPSQDLAVRAILSEAGTAAAKRLIEDGAGFVSHSEIVTSEEFVDVADPAPAPADVRANYFLRRRPELTRDEMLAYWSTSHKGLFLSLQPALNYRAYNQLHVRSAPDLTTVAQRLGGGAGEEFDGVAESAFASQWVLVRGIFSPQTELANLKLVKDETGFIDHHRSISVYGNHYRF